VNPPNNEAVRTSGRPSSSTSARSTSTPSGRSLSARSTPRCSSSASSEVTSVNGRIPATIPLASDTPSVRSTRKQRAWDLARRAAATQNNCSDRGSRANENVDGSLTICPAQHDASVGDGIQHVVSWMPVSVAGANADHRDRRCRGCDEVEVDVARPVVRDCDNVDVQQRGVLPQRRVRRRPGVTGQQHRTSGSIHP
jgi:hypothetical protein